MIEPATSVSPLRVLIVLIGPGKILHVPAHQLEFTDQVLEPGKGKQG
jgi:hypothetical protein